MKYVHINGGQERMPVQCALSLAVFREKCIVVFCLDFKFSTELSSVVDPDLDKRN